MSAKKTAETEMIIIDGLDKLTEGYGKESMQDRGVRHFVSILRFLASKKPYLPSIMRVLKQCIHALFLSPNLYTVGTHSTVIPGKSYNIMYYNAYTFNE